MTHDHAKDLCAFELGPLICRIYARSCCTCNRAVRTDKMILKGPVQPFTHHSPHSSKLIIVIVFSMITWSSPSRSPASGRSTSEDRTTWSQWFQDSEVSLHPPLLLLVHARSDPVVHMMDVWHQSRLVRGRRDRSTLDLKISLFSSLTILWGNLTWTAFTEDLLMCSYTRYVCQLLQLFYHLRLDVDVVTHLPECFVEPGILF